MSSAKRRAIVVAVRPQDVAEAEVHRSIEELKQLLVGLGIAPVRTFVQRAPRPARAYLGEGKVREVAAYLGEHVAEGAVVVADDELAPSAQRSLEAALGVDVLDRTAIILRVFASRARTREARLEIELARLEYELPRIRDDRSLGDREGGGGRGGRGHSNVELAKQRTRKRIAALRSELAVLGVRNEQRTRSRADVSTVALVGYTNAGKSSLMRALTGSDVYVEDAPFATLATTVRRLSPPAERPIVVADTVGFIERLPHALVASFRTTLSEVRHAALLVHVVDASAPSFRTQMETTERVLAEMGAHVPTVVVFNKADRLSAEERATLAAEHPSAMVMSAHDREDCAHLRRRIEEALRSCQGSSGSLH